MTPTPKVTRISVDGIHCRSKCLRTLQKLDSAFRTNWLGGMVIPPIPRTSVSPKGRLLTSRPPYFS